MSIHVNTTDFCGTPFNSRTAPLNINQRWMAWDKYHMVDSFSGFEDEYRAIREDAATIDMSPLGKFDVIGKDAERFMNYLVTRDIRKQEVDQIFYSCWCNEEGKMVNDGMIFRIAEDHFRISSDPQLNWLNEHTAKFDVEIFDVSHDYGILALQGPLSQQVLEAATGEDWSDLPFSRIRQITMNGADVNLMRQGFTGELGYELWVKSDDAPIVWDALYKNANAYALRPAGFHAHDVARMEAGLIIVGPDYTGAGSDADRGAAIKVDPMDQRSPYEARLGMFVHLDKGDFLGKRALQKEKEQGANKKMMGVLIEWEGIAELYTRQGLPPVIVPAPIWYPHNIINNGNKIGRATSIAWSPAVNSIAGFAFIDADCAVEGGEVKIEFNVNGKNDLINSRLKKLPFVEIKRSQ